MKMTKTLAALMVAGGLLGGVAATQMISVPEAHAQSAAAKQIVDRAKSEGVIGETAGGYLAVTGSGTPKNVVDAMNEINIGRKTIYTRLARQQNVQVDVVAALTGEKQIAKAKAGEKVLTKANRWQTVR